MSCLKRELFIEQQDITEDLVCRLCKGVLNKPVKTHCGHLFCESCLRNYLATNPHCPQCEQACGGDYAPAAEQSQRIDDLDVVCEHSESINEPGTAAATGGWCEWRGKYKDLGTHLKDQCEHHVVDCKNPGCSFKGLRPALLLHSLVCGYKMVKCEWCGNESIQSLSKKMHDDICTEKTIMCLLECGAEMKRKQYEVHRRKECPNNYTNIHVKGFSNTTTDSELNELFKPYGEIIHLKLVGVNEKNNKFAYCFVCYRTPEAAHSAQTSLNNTIWKKRAIYVSKAVTPRHIWSEYRKLYQDCCIYIRNLPAEVTEEELAKTFSDFGFVFATHIVTTQLDDSAVKVPKGCAYVCFSTASEAEMAVGYCGSNQLFKRQLLVNKYVPEEERKAQQFAKAASYGYYYGSKSPMYNYMYNPNDYLPSYPYPYYSPYYYQGAPPSKDYATELLSMVSTLDPMNAQYIVQYVMQTGGESLAYRLVSGQEDVRQFVLNLQAMQSQQSAKP